MPYYQVLAPAGMLSEQTRSEIAKAITHHHCTQTGAPASFVHVHFPEWSAATQFTGGEVDDNIVIVIASLREGRSIREKQVLLRKISQSISKVTSKPEKELILTINEITSSTSMEFGLVLPQPGGEPEWFDKNKEVLGGVSAEGF